tara:strand:- start:452 stop:1636 length:1185 start_codon:yes stop_codon:yes gene_type:complete
MLRIDTIEDCLEILAGFRKESDGFALMKEDYTIMHSIARQVFKGTALTDRQFALMQTKLLSYKDQFDKSDISLQESIKNLRQPLRTINREKYIKLVEGRIKLRFPFKKSDIMLVNEVDHPSWQAEGYNHTKGSHEHFFRYDEVNVLNLLDRFIEKGFTIDPEILEVWHEMKHMEHEKDKHVPGIFNMELKNVKDGVVSLIEDDLGPLDKSTFLKYVDRRFKYGIEHVDNHEPTLGYEKIAYRNGIWYESKPSEIPLTQLLDDLWNLDRFPMLVVLDKANAEDQLHAMLTYYRDILDTAQQSVLFRFEDKAAGFNQLVKDRKVNNWVDKSTKVVYISKDKLPKLLVNCDWKPSVTLCFDSATDKTLNTFISSTCDLIIFREEYLSPFRRHSKIYG